MTGLVDLSLAEMAGGLDDGAISSVDLVTAHLTAIEAANPILNAVWDVDADGALAAALASDVRRGRGDSLSELDGIPFGLKDNIDVAGRPTSDGLGTAWIPAGDAAITERLREAGAIPLAKLAMHEAALGGTSDNPHRGRVDNPVLPGHTPGGSSGGSAAAVAAGLVPLALGTDTLGSVRIPAAYCGVVGFKPSFDLLPTLGVTPLCWTLDHVGPIARSVIDLALTLPVLTNMEIEEVELSGLVLGWPAEVDACEIEPAVQGVIDAALDRLRAGGVQIRQVKLGFGDLSILRRAALLVIEAEGAVALEKIWEDHPEALSETLSGMLSYGRDAAAARYVKAYRRIEDAGEVISAALDVVDALILPTTPQTPFAADARAPVNQADLTSIANYAGTPAVSLPVPGGGAPVGLQLVGGFYEDAQLLGIALAVEDLLRS
ncbi:MAG: amidase [Thalassobaculaceae bacterium]|nr:amidase [Thalassobaculaceae bacterium]